MSKEWSGGSLCGPGGCCEEWSVHAQLTINPQQASNITVTSEGARGDSGYGSEKGACTPTARATCSVTLAGHHTVTLTCSDIPVVPVPPPAQPKEKWVYCNHHDKLRSAAGAPPSVAPSSSVAPTPPPPPPPVYKDVASQTSSSNIPQLQIQTQTQTNDETNQLETKHKVSTFIMNS